MQRFTLLHPKSIDLSLGRISDLLAKLDNPQRKLPPVIHIGGTNGKGSVVSYIRSILEVAGYQVQSYTSPHLINFNERIRLADGLISNEWLEELLEECEKANKGTPITFFEITTAAAFLAFSRSPADVLVVEVGLGGRLDTTNTIEKPILTAITPISLDHTSFIGQTLEKIAREKAGIIKSAVPLVLGPQQPNTLAVIAQHARELGAPIYQYNSDWKVTTRNTNGVLLTTENRKIHLHNLSLDGIHQAYNAGQAAVCALNLYDFSINESAIIKGIASTIWPARLQNVDAGPLRNHLPASCDLWVDSGHNPGASVALAETLRNWNSLDKRSTYLILGMMRTKDVSGFLEPLTDLVDKIIAIPIHNEATSHKPNSIKLISDKIGIAAQTAENIQNAILSLSTEKSLHKSRILICGSVYLAGHALQINGYSIN